MAASTCVFSAPDHAHLVPYLAALHASCITHDRMIGTFLPPLHHEKLLAWWKDRLSEVNAGTRVIVLLLNELQPGARAKGTDLVGVAMLALPKCETGPFRGSVEKVLVSNKFRGHGGARALTLDVESDTAAEAVFKKLGYVEVGRIPKYSINPAGQVRPQSFFYKDLAL